MTNNGQWMAVDEPALFEEPQYSPPASHRRRRSHTVWSPDQFLDPMVLIATAPMALFPDRFPRESFLIAAALLVVPYAVRKSNSGSFTAPTLMIWPILFLFVAVLPYTIWVSPDFWAVSWPEFVRFVWGIAVLLGVVNWCAAGEADIRSDGRQAAIEGHTVTATAAWFALGAVFTAVGMLALRTSSKVPLLSDLVSALPEATWLPESVAQGFNANRVAGLAVLFVPFALALTLAPAGRRRVTASGIITRVIMFASLLFFGSALLLTQSRAALLSALLAVILVSALAGRRGIVPIVLLGIVAVAALDVFGAGGLVDTFSVESQASAQDGVWRSVLADRNVAGRLVIWRRALHGIADEPLTGMGLAGFEQRSQEPYAPMPDWEPDPDVVHAHNLFLQTGLDLGLPGLAALLAIIGIAIWESVNIFTGTRPGSPARFWGIGAAGALAAFVLYNMLDAVTVGARPAVSYWFLLGLIAGAAVALRTARQQDEPAY